MQSLQIKRNELDINMRMYALVPAFVRVCQTIDPHYYTWAIIQ